MKILKYLFICLITTTTFSVASGHHENPHNFSDCKGSVGNLYVDPDGTWLARSSRIDLKAKGPGDFLTALWLGRFVQTRDGIDALRFAVGGAQMVIENANVCGSVELPIVETAEAWLSHSQDVPIERLR